MDLEKYIPQTNMFGKHEHENVFHALCNKLKSYINMSSLSRDRYVESDPKRDQHIRVFVGSRLRVTFEGFWRQNVADVGHLFDHFRRKTSMWISARRADEKLIFKDQGHHNLRKHQTWDVLEIVHISKSQF